MGPLRREQASLVPFLSMCFFLVPTLLIVNTVMKITELWADMLELLRSRFVLLISYFLEETDRSSVVH